VFNTTFRAVGEAATRFAPAFKRTALYSGLGLFLGFLLRLAQSSLERFAKAWPNPPEVKALVEVAAFFCEHLSVGFVVSAVAVFLYEWGAHARETLHLSQQLTDLLGAHGERALRKAVKGLFPEQQHASLRESHAKYFRALSSLNKDDWGRDGYIRFLTMFIEVAAQHAYDLARMSTGPNDPNHAFTLNLHPDTEFSDRILAEQMRLMKKGDFYDTLSNPGTWTVLSEFGEAGSEAVAAGAIVRRVFVVGDKDDTWNSEDLKNLAGHYGKAATLQGKGGSRYRVHIATAADLTRLHVPADERHYGIFRHHKGVILFDVAKKRNLAKFEMHRLTKDDARIQDFERIWKDLERSYGKFPGASGADMQLAAGRFLDLLFDRELVHMLKTPGKHSYQIVTTLESWRERRRMEVFDHSLKSALDRHRIAVRHLFISAAAAIKPEAQVLSRTFGKRYEVMVCTKEQLGVDTDTGSGHWEHAQFTTGETPRHTYVFCPFCDDELKDLLWMTLRMQSFLPGGLKLPGEWRRTRFVPPTPVIVRRKGFFEACCKCSSASSEGCGWLPNERRKVACRHAILRDRFIIFAVWGCLRHTLRDHDRDEAGGNHRWWNRRALHGLASDEGGECRSGDALRHYSVRV
jgi:hypothetical protein